MDNETTTNLIIEKPQETFSAIPNEKTIEFVIDSYEVEYGVRSFDQACTVKLTPEEARSVARYVDSLTLPHVERKPGEDDHPDGGFCQYTRFSVNDFTFAWLEEEGHVSIRGFGAVPTWLAYGFAHSILQACIEREAQAEEGRLKRLKTDG